MLTVATILIIELQGAVVVGDGIKRVFQGAADVAHAVVDSTGAVVGATTGLMVTAASKTPVLKNVVKVYVHRYAEYFSLFFMTINNIRI